MIFSAFWLGAAVWLGYVIGKVRGHDEAWAQARPLIDDTEAWRRAREADGR